MAKGKSVKHVDLKNDPPDDDELVRLMTGPTGALRAPTIRRGKKLFVGFNAEEFADDLLR